MIRTKHFRQIILLVALALIGLMVVQLFWVREAYRLKENALNRQANDALVRAATAVEKDATCFTLFSKVYIKPHEGIYLARQAWAGTPQDRKWVPASEKAPDSVKLFMLDDTEKDSSVLYDYNSLKLNWPIKAEVIMRCQLQLHDTVPEIYEQRAEINNYPENISVETLKNRMDGNRPIADRIRLNVLDSVLRKEILAEKLDTTYHYGILRGDKNKLEFVSSGADTQRLMASVIHTRLLDDTYFNRPYRLLVYFDHTDRAAIGSLVNILLISALVIVLLCYAFLYFIRTIRRQKKLSEMKNDFINNLTHEFKTPITNIALALEVLGDSRPMERDGQIVRIIQEENDRMRENVERILQIASLERETIQLHEEPINLHQLIARIVEHSDLINNPKRPDIVCRLEAENPWISGDETHVLNMLYNLMDNAIKYCPGLPLVRISTYNTGDKLAICIEDNGCGMDADTQKRIFDRFYRAHTGDIHNAKGFGLGLSYVKTLVMAHGGTVEVESEKGRGSLFTLLFPALDKVEKPLWMEEQ